MNVGCNPRGRFNSVFMLLSMVLPTRPGRLLKFISRLVAPQTVATLTLVATNFSFPICIAAYCLSQAQYSHNFIR